MVENVTLGSVTLADLDSVLGLDFGAPLDTMVVNGEGVGVNPILVVLGVVFRPMLSNGLGVGCSCGSPVGLGVGTNSVVVGGIGVGSGLVGLGVGDSCIIPVGLGVGFCPVAPVGLGVGLIPSSIPANESGTGQMARSIVLEGTDSAFMTMTLLLFLLSKEKESINLFYMCMLIGKSV